MARVGFGMCGGDMSIPAATSRGDDGFVVLLLCAGRSSHFRSTLPPSSGGDVSLFPLHFLVHFSLVMVVGVVY